MKQFLKFTIPSIILLVVGFLISELFLKFSLSLSNLDNSILAVTGIKDTFKLKIGFGLSLASIPLLIFLVKKIGKTISKSQSVISLVLIILTGVFFWGYRLWTLNKISEWPINIGGNSKDIQISLAILKLNEFIGFGFLFGAIISGLIFRRKNKNEMVTHR
tara:strand:- start:20 stop:502 length:483 start_codon:yes stop_codon:yes gene_type:complete